MNNLRAIRRKRLLTQAELSALSGVPRQYICAIERGKRVLYVKTAARLAPVLKCSVKRLRPSRLVAREI